MHRRSVLAGSGLALVAVAAGCASSDPSTPDCRLSHEILSGSSNSVEPLETYRYENLSDDARAAFDAALEDEDGHFATTEEESNPPEFRYWDETARYEIEYRNETHRLLTYSSEGCEPE